MSRLLLVGATGQQGGSVRAALDGRGHELVALVRDRSSAKAAALEASGVTLVEGDLADKASIASAMDGVDAAFAVTTPFEAGTEVEAQQGVNIADAAAQARLPYLVFSSVASADESTAIPHFDSKFVAEQRIRELGLRAAVVAPVYFMENLLFPWNVPAYRAGALRLPLPPDVALQLVSSVDIGSVVAEVIANPDTFAGERLELAGDELTAPQMAATLGDAMGRPLAYEVQPIEEIAPMGPDMVAMYEWFVSTGYSTDTARLARDLPAVHMHTFAEWARAQDWESVLAGG